MTLAAAYFILVCNQTAGVVVEREVDDRQVSRWFPIQMQGKAGYHNMKIKVEDHMRTWLKEGLIESANGGEIYKIELQHECQLT